MTGYTVEQGPRWLAHLIYNPPPWMLAAIGLAILTTLAVIVYATRRGVFDRDVIQQQVQGVAALVCCGTFAAVIAPLPYPYIVDVVAATAGGLIVAYGAVTPAAMSLVDRLARESLTQGEWDA